MSAAYEIAKVAVPAAIVVAVMGGLIAIRRRADKKGSAEEPGSGSGGGDFGYVSDDYGHRGDPGGHGHHGDHGGGDGGGHDGGGGGHH